MWQLIDTAGTPNAHLQLHDKDRDNEMEAEDDILWSGPEVTYSSILIKVFVMLEYAADVGARWLLKTDDDAYINVPQAVQVRHLSPQYHGQEA